MDVTGGEPDVYALRYLTSVWMAAGDAGRSQMLELARQTVEACPPDNKELLAEVTMDYGKYLVVAGQRVEGADAFWKVIQLDENNAEALNNYAFLLGDGIGTPAEALPYAEHAFRLQPNNPNVLDTYGWLLFKLGDNQRARRLLEEAVKQPKGQTADKLLHLAHVLVAMGDFDLAEAHLERAANMLPDPNTRAEISRLRDDIRTMRQRGG
jgi:Tfp pilus assembly protein PilF